MTNISGAASVPPGIRSGARRLSRWVLALTVVVLAASGSALARAKPSYNSPGYAGTHRLPHVAPVAPPKPVFLPHGGHNPRVLVDAAGTAHLVWSEDPPQTPGILHYCRLPRGSGTCTTTYDRTILQPNGGGNGPETDVDFDGPYPLSVGNELLILDSRCCNAANAPDGATTSNPNYLFTSEDGGTSFTGPDDPNGSAGIIGNQDPSGGAIVFNGESPMVGTISDTQTGGTIFQGVPAGQFTREKANLSVRSDQSDAYDGRLAVDGIRPVASFDDLNGVTVVREWNGQGSVNDPANWSVLKIPNAFGPRIAGGASGLLLLSHTASGILQVRRISAGAASAGPPTALGKATGDFNVISEAPNGWAAVARIVSDPNQPTVEVRTSPDGVKWTDLGAVTRVPNGNLNDLSVGVAVDGGGVVTFRDINGAPTSFSGRIGVAQFGPATATGQRGLGLLPGDAGGPPGDPGAFVACTKIHFGVIDALSKAGCFLRDPANPQSGAAVTSGELRLNGLDIIPDPGVKVGIDPRAMTINTTGAVTVRLDGIGVDPVTLWHGELHVHLASDATGVTLFDFDTGQFSSALEGFPFSGRIQVKLLPDAVDIPVHLALPPYFGGVNGDADLKANNVDGLVLDSLHLGIDDANIGVLELKNVHLDYKRAGSIWDGSGELLLPGPLSPDIKATVRFEGGTFKYGQLELGIKPGILVFSDVYLHDFLLGFGLHPTVIVGGISVGVYDGIGGYPLDVVGRVKIQVGDASNPTIVFIGGTGRVLGFDLVHANFTYNSDGYVLFHIDAGLDLGLATFKASGDVFVLHGDFGANLSAHVCLHFDVVPDVCGGFDGAASPKGLSLCSDAFGLDVPDWNPFKLTVYAGDCDVSQYQLQAPPAGSASARGAAAGDRTFIVTRGQRVFNLELIGRGGAPKVDLVSPGGQVIVPAPGGFKTASVIGLQARTLPETFIGIRKPQPGVWKVRPVAGSAPIVSLSTAHEIPLPRIRANVTGAAGSRTLSYEIDGAQAGTRVRFAEQAREGMALIGSGHSGRGQLRFTPAPGAGGSRPVIAIVTQDGYTRAQPVVAHYLAPALRMPASVTGLTLERRGTKLRIRFASAQGAVRYVVRVVATGGLDTQRTTGRTSLTFTGLRPGAAIAVTVRAVNVRGAAGPGRTVKLPASGTPPSPRHRPS